MPLASIDKFPPNRFGPIIPAIRKSLSEKVFENISRSAQMGQFFSICWRFNKLAILTAFQTFTS